MFLLNPEQTFRRLRQPGNPVETKRIAECVPVTVVGVSLRKSGGIADCIFLCPDRILPFAVYRLRISQRFQRRSGRVEFRRAFRQNWRGALLPGAQPILESFVIPGRIAVMLMGCLPLLELLFRLAHHLLDPLGRRLGVNGVTLEALLLITTTAIPAFSMLRDMPPKGKTAAIAWMCGTMGLVTSHYAFALGVDPSVCLPQAAAKLVVGCIGLGIALAIPATSDFYHGTSTGSLQKEH